MNDNAFGCFWARRENFRSCGAWLLRFERAAASVVLTRCDRADHHGCRPGKQPPSDPFHLHVQVAPIPSKLLGGADCFQHELQGSRVGRARRSHRLRQRSRGEGAVSVPAFQNSVSCNETYPDVCNWRLLDVWRRGWKRGGERFASEGARAERQSAVLSTHREGGCGSCPCRCPCPCRRGCCTVGRLRARGCGCS